MQLVVRAIQCLFGPLGRMVRSINWASKSTPTVWSRVAMAAQLVFGSVGYDIHEQVVVLVIQRARKAFPLKKQ